MNTGARPLSDLLVALFGPIVWSMHFFALYLMQALLCTTLEATAPVYEIGVGVTIAALVALLTFAVRRHQGSQAIAASVDARELMFAFAGPLTALSILAVLWTSVPLFLLPACGAAGG
jgi:hypothetical protein